MGYMLVTSRLWPAASATATRFSEKIMCQERLVKRADQHDRLLYTLNNCYFFCMDSIYWIMAIILPLLSM